MTTPALQRLREALPGARITVLSHEKIGALWERQPFVDEVVTFGAKDSVWRTGRRLREGAFDLGLALPNSFRAALEIWLARVPRRVGYGGRGRNLLLTDVVPPRAGIVLMRKRPASEIKRLVAAGGAPQPVARPSAHHLHNYLHLAAALGASSEPMAPRIVVEEEEMTEARRRFGLTADARRPWFGLNPGAEYGPAKRWPPERFVAAAVEISRRIHCRWLIFGSAGYAEIAEAMANTIDKATPGDHNSVLNLAGKTYLRNLCAAIKCCQLVVTNDTGPMHLASAVGTPVVALFGSTSPELTGPVSPQARIVRSATPCAPCFLRECPIDLRCLRQIEPETVVDAVLKLNAAFPGDSGSGQERLDH